MELSQQYENIIYTTIGIKAWKINGREFCTTTIPLHLLLLLLEQKKETHLWRAKRHLAKQSGNNNNSESLDKFKNNELLEKFKKTSTAGWSQTEVKNINRTLQVKMEAKLVALSDKWNKNTAIVERVSMEISPLGIAVQGSRIVIT